MEFCPPCNYKFSFQKCRLAQSVKLMIAVAIFLTYTLQFYVPMEIIWKNVKGNFNEHKVAAEYSIRIGLVVSIYTFLKGSVEFF